MTRAEAIKKAARDFDAIYTAQIRQLIDDLVRAGHDDDTVAEVVAMAIEQHDEARRTFVRNVRAGMDEHFPITH
jgi:hypothetical protein